MSSLSEEPLISINAAIGLNSNGLKQKLFTCSSNNWFFVLFSLSVGINTSRTSGYEKYSSVYFWLVAKFLLNDVVVRNILKDRQKWLNSYKDSRTCGFEETGGEVKIKAILMINHFDASPPSKENSVPLALNDSLHFDTFVTAGNCVLCLLIPLTFVGDVAVYAAFHLNRNLRTRTNAIFLSLVTSDILLALLVLPFEVVRLSYYPHWPLGETACNIWNSVFVGLGSASICHLCAVSIDRLLAISRPLRYCSDISARLLASIVFLWSFAFLSGLGSYFIWTQPNTLECAELSAPLTRSILLLVFNLLVPFVICLLTYAKIFHISRRQAKQIVATCRWIDRRNNYLSVERKSAKTLGILVGVFTFTYIPFLVFHALDGAFDEKLPNRFYIGSVVKWLTFGSSAINWALYGFLNKEYRAALCKIFNIVGCKACRRETNQMNNIEAHTISWIRNKWIVVKNLQ